MAENTMKKVVLLGDSIRLSYWERVRELLADVCEVYAPEENCAYTMHTLRCVRHWFTSSRWENVDLIHWNNGIWDHHRNAEDGEPLSTPEMYLYLNRRLHKQLALYAKKLCWATTIPAGEHYTCNPKNLCAISREEWNRETVLYNDLLVAYLRYQGVSINDLYTLVAQHPEYQGGDGIHLTPVGV